MTKPYSNRIFLPTGDPGGIRTIEKSNWSGIGLVFPRSLFAEARARKELERTGAYVLIGPPEDNGIQKIYISVSKRPRGMEDSKGTYIEVDPGRRRVEVMHTYDENWF